MSLKIQPVILAGGTGFRMGIPKLFCRLNNKTFLEWILDNLPDHVLQPAVVIRSEYQDKAKELYPEVKKWIVNPNPDKGMISSVIIALQQLDADNYLLIPVDYPLVLKSSYELLCQSCQEHCEQIIKPVYQNRRGHPIIVPKVLKMHYNECLTDLRHWIHLSEIPLFMLKIEDPGVVGNFNTPEDLERV